VTGSKVQISACFFNCCSYFYYCTSQAIVSH